MFRFTYAFDDDLLQSSVESIDCDGNVMVSGTAEGTVHVWSTQKEDIGVLKMYVMRIVL